MKNHTINIKLTNKTSDNTIITHNHKSIINGTVNSNRFAEIINEIFKNAQSENAIQLNIHIKYNYNENNIQTT